MAWDWHKDRHRPMEQIRVQKDWNVYGQLIFDKVVKVNQRKKKKKYIYTHIFFFFSKKGVATAAAAAESLQSCPTLCDPIDGNPPGSPIPGILQARTLEWVAISFSNAWKWKVKVKPLSCVRPLAAPSTAAYQAPLSMGFSRQEYWSGLPLPSPLKQLDIHIREKKKFWIFKSYLTTYTKFNSKWMTQI